MPEGIIGTTDFQSCWVELILPNSSTTLIGAIYRALDGNFSHSMNSMKNVNTKMNLSPTIEHIMNGYFNVALNKNYAKYKTHIFCQFVKTPTHVSNKIATVTDHVYGIDVTSYGEYLTHVCLIRVLFLQPGKTM